MNKRPLSLSSAIATIWISGAVFMLVFPQYAFVIIGVFSMIYYLYSRTPVQRMERAFKKATNHFRKGEFKIVVFLLEDLKKKHADFDPYVHYILGAAYHNLGKYKESIRPLEIYEELMPNNYDNWLILSNAYFNQGQYEKAVKLLCKVPQNFPRYMRVINIWGDCLVTLGKEDLAQEIYKKALTIKETFAGELDELKKKIID